MSTERETYWALLWTTVGVFAAVVLAQIVGGQRQVLTQTPPRVEMGITAGGTPVHSVDTMLVCVQPAASRVER